MRFNLFHEKPLQYSQGAFSGKGIKKRGKLIQFPLFTAVVPGFEPGQTEPKPVVLPLHHTTISLLTSRIRLPFKDRAKIEKTILL